MDILTIGFSRNHLIGSYVIRKLTHSEFSHCAILTDSNKATSKSTIIDATFKHGVAERPYSDFILQNSNFEFISIEIPCLKTFLEEARKEIGKRYDLSALAGFIENRNWQEDDKWFCSELIAYILNKLGILSLDNVYKVTPQIILEALIPLRIAQTKGL